MTKTQANAEFLARFQDLQIATKKYRAQEIGDDEYLKVRSAHDAALKTWHEMDVSEN